MIFDNLDNHSRYMGLDYNVPMALKFLLNNDLQSLPPGRMDLDDDNMYVMVQEYMTKPASQGKWEAHRKYIDVQYIVSGHERMEFANICTMQPGEYFPDKDFQSLSGAGSYVDLFPGSFVVFFPEDAHMPCLSINVPEPVKKVVLKVKI